MATLSSYRDLIVWQRALALAKDVYIHSKELPKEERYGLTSQMRRAAISVAANTAEGYGRRNRGEYLQFLGIARGSLRELETYLILVKELAMISNVEILPERAEEIEKLLYRLESSLT